MVDSSISRIRQMAQRHMTVLLFVLTKLEISSGIAGRTQISAHLFLDKNQINHGYTSCI